MKPRMARINGQEKSKSNCPHTIIMKDEWSTDRLWHISICLHCKTKLNAIIALIKCDECGEWFPPKEKVDGYRRVICMSCAEKITKESL